MLIRCRTNRYKDLPEDSEEYYPNAGDDTCRLEMEKLYIVYGIAINHNEILYCVVPEQYTWYPLWHSSAFFEVVDGRMPSCWRYFTNIPNAKKTTRCLFTFPEWIEPGFEWGLLDGDPKKCAIWDRYKKIIERETDPTFNATCGKTPQPPS